MSATKYFLFLYIVLGLQLQQLARNKSILSQ